MLVYSYLTLVTLLLHYFLRGSQGANILGLFPHASEGHFNVMRAIMTELAKRDHNVTVYTSHRLGEHIDNLNEFVVEPEFEFWTQLQRHAAPGGGGLSELSKLSIPKLQQSLAEVGAAGVGHFLMQKPLQDLLNLSGIKFDFDIIIVDIFYTEALLAFGHVHRKPTIGIVNTNFGFYMSALQENIVPSACSPIQFEESQENELSYWRRLSNIRNCMARRKQFVRYHYSAQDQLIKKHFKITTSVPELQAEMGVLLLNNHVPLSTPRPLLQNIVSAGGLHITSPRELPWHIKRFLDESRAGLIYMHLGNEQLCADLPKGKINAIFSALSKRKERVIWTCHDIERIDNMPKNMIIQHSAPQTDIIAHPHVRVFLMNGDLLGLQESIVRHVPVLGLPIFASEIAHMDIAVKLGVGLQISQTNISEYSLTWALDELLTDKQYAVQIRKISAEYRDRPLGALASTMFWIDYVLRHGGGQIKSHGIGISSSQLHLFDLFIFYFGLAMIIVLLLVGLYYAALLVWKKQQVKKLYSKLN